MKHDVIENLYDRVDEMAMLLVEHASLTYLDALCGVSANLAQADVLQEVETEIEIKLFSLGKQLSEMAFEVEEVRKALQLALLKGLKADGVGLDVMTPDSIGLLMGYLMNQLIPHTASIRLADFVVGTGNLLTAVLNTFDKPPAAIYGVDVDDKMLELSQMMADMQAYEIQFFHQSSAQAMAIGKVDVIIGDLPTVGQVEAVEMGSELAVGGCRYLPYLLVENHLNYLAEGGYGLYVIGNDFFSQEDAAKFHEVLTHRASMGILLQLPESLFKDPSEQKRLFVIRKHGKGTAKVGEVLVGNVPNIGNIEEFRTMLTKLEKWITMNKWMRR